jgi:hypothetical protein
MSNNINNNPDSKLNTTNPNNDNNNINDIFIYELLENHINYCNAIEKISINIKGMKNIRQPNFPESLSEYIAKKCYSEKYNKCVIFGKSGDLLCDGEKIEVKAFASNSPSSFGPKENWKELIFVDAQKFKEKKFKIYKINLSNEDIKWKNLKVNLTETFNDQCNKKRRPRIKFSQIYKMLKNDTELLFDGQISLENNKIKFSNN